MVMIDKAQYAMGQQKNGATWRPTLQRLFVVKKYLRLAIVKFLRFKVRLGDSSIVMYGDRLAQLQNIIYETWVGDLTHRALVV
jgi:hypothetical protein